MIDRPCVITDESACLACKEFTSRLSAVRADYGDALTQGHTAGWPLRVSLAPTCLSRGVWLHARLAVRRRVLGLCRRRIQP